MNIKFQELTIKNFLSYSEATIDLTNKGYCVIKGINKNPKDNAQSNGVGKSTLLSAIAWCLTGETIGGLTTNVANIYINKGCSVNLKFKADDIQYDITRYRNDPKMKTSLKLLIDGQDKSGKTIKESDSILKEYLPDLTIDLIRSVIIIGQGMPGKFSNNTPSGRKEVLEKLSKSDFMIADIKNRISKRCSTLSDKIQTINNELLKVETSKNLYQTQLEEHSHNLEDLLKPKDFDSQLNSLTEESTKLKNLLETKQTELENSIKNKDSLNSSLLEINEKLNQELYQEKNIFSELDNTYYKEQINNSTKQSSLNSEIIRLKNIKDVCPTCGQKIPGIIKPDTSKQEKEIQQLKESYTLISNKKEENTNNHIKKENEIKAKYSDQINNYKTQISKLNEVINPLNTFIKESSNKQSKLNVEYAKILEEKNSHLKLIQTTKNKIEELDKKIKEMDDIISLFTNKKNNTQEHLDVINKMDTLIKRDFRGYLLKNVIEFINKKSKEYCKEVFNTDELNFRLEGNNIEITYCNKDFDVLSGGEKQKVDIILQLALRDMMCRYLKFSANIIAIDEVFDALDSISCSSIIDLITKKLNDVESVFIISHRGGTLGLPTDTEIIIEKDENGISHLRN